RSQLEPAVASVTVGDRHTVALDLKRPWAPLLAALAERPGWIVSPAAVQKAGENYGRHPVGTGPFRFVEWVSDSHAIVERFPDYWETGKPYLDRVHFRVVPDPTVRTLMVRSGEADITTELDAKDAPSLQQDPNLSVSEMKAAWWYSLQWHVDKPPFNN